MVNRLLSRACVASVAAVDEVEFLPNQLAANESIRRVSRSV
jgi:hypothetical protein